MGHRLYHISDLAGIRRFEPRITPKCAQFGACVWAIDAAHVANQMLPRNCPRVTFHTQADSDPVDVERLIGPGSDGAVRHVVAIESRWWPALRVGRLVRYAFDAARFRCVDEVAGYYISHEPVDPVEETPIDDILAALLACEVEVRILRSLWDLREAVIRSSLGYSIIRMNHAQPPEAGFERYHPLP